MAIRHARPGSRRSGRCRARCPRGDSCARSARDLGAQPVGIAPGNHQGALGNIDGEHVRLGHLEGQRHRETSAADAPTSTTRRRRTAVPSSGRRGAARTGAASRFAERFFDDELRLRTRCELVAADLEVAHPELADAGDLRHRFAPFAPRDEPRMRRCKPGGEDRSGASTRRGSPSAIRASASASNAAVSAGSPAAASRERAAATRSCRVIHIEEQCRGQRSRCGSVLGSFLQFLGLIVRHHGVDELRRSPFSTSVSRCVV